jgi:DNA-binding NarL/FixJ family response regulator
MRTILIVDDHPSFRATARTMLELEGYDVVGEAEDGAAALRAVEVLRPEIVLLDVQLPDIDGFEVTNRLQALNGARPQVVLTSSRDGSDFGRLVEQSAALGFVPKSELCGDTLAALLE